MTPPLFKNVLVHTLILTVTLTCLLLGHYIYYLMSIKALDPTSPGNNGYLATLEDDLQTVVAKLPYVLLQIERTYRRHDAAVRHVGGTFAAHLVDLVKTCLFNRLTGSFASFVLSLFLVCGYLSVGIITLAVLGPVAAKVCLLSTIVFSVASRLCLDTGLFLVKQVTGMFGEMRRLLEGVALTDHTTESGPAEGDSSHHATPTDPDTHDDIHFNDDYPAFVQVENNDDGPGNQGRDSVASISSMFPMEEVQDGSDVSSKRSIYG